MNPLSVTRERFLVAISQRVPADAVEEAHFFKPIKQGGVESGVAVVAVREVGGARLAIYNAQYRLTLKGPERGKWEFSIKAEADAPLVTVDQVVRGVQRRSGDEEDPLRLTGDEVRTLVPAPSVPVASSSQQPPSAAT